MPKESFLVLDILSCIFYFYNVRYFVYIPYGKTCMDTNA